MSIPYKVSGLVGNTMVHIQNVTFYEREKDEKPRISVYFKLDDHYEEKTMSFSLFRKEHTKNHFKVKFFPRQLGLGDWSVSYTSKEFTEETHGPLIQWIHQKLDEWIKNRIEHKNKELKEWVWFKTQISLTLEKWLETAKKDTHNPDYEVGKINNLSEKIDEIIRYLTARNKDGLSINDLFSWFKEIPIKIYQKVKVDFGVFSPVEETITRSIWIIYEPKETGIRICDTSISVTIEPAVVYLTDHYWQLDR